MSEDQSSSAASDLSTIDIPSFSIERHEQIAGVASGFLSPRCAQRVREILGAAEADLSTVAGWADRVKRRTPTADDDADTVAFLEDERNAKNDVWHYVDLPFGAAAYDRAKYAEFTRDDDVVQMLGQAIDVLGGGGDRFTPLNALRLVVHLVGDVHQPLHVGCSYVGGTKTKPALVSDPIQASGLPSDHGGNRIILPLGSKGLALHSYWDSRLGGKGALPTDAPAPAGANPAGAPRDWPVAWATSSLGVAAQAYNGLTMTGALAGTSNFAVDFAGGKEAYDARCAPLLSAQMVLASQNLARLLNQVLK